MIEPFEIAFKDGNNYKVWVILCEDMWDDDYYAKTVDILKEKWAGLIFDLSCSPFWIGKQGKRDKILTVKSKGIEMIYSNNVWIQNNGKNIFLFDWASVIYKDWKKIAQADSFEDTQLDKVSQIAEDSREIAKISNWLIYWIKEYFSLIKKDKVVLWLSWWIDSAVVAALMVLALWKDNVACVNMPSVFNSNMTQDYAKRQAELLWIEYNVFPIQEAVDMTVNDFEQIFWERPSWLVLENIQARDRWSRVLAWFAALRWAVFTNNGNKSEIALGYATLYGDVNWSICPIWDLYKTQVWDLARYLNSRYWVIVLPEIIDMIPSAELSSDQNVEEWKWDPFNYSYLDRILYQLIELRKDPLDLLEMYKDKSIEDVLWFPVYSYFENAKEFITDLERVSRNLNLYFFKRIQAPPILTVSKRAFWFRWIYVRWIRNS